MRLLLALALSFCCALFFTASAQRKCLSCRADSWDNCKSVEKTCLAGARVCSSSIYVIEEKGFHQIQVERACDNETEHPTSSSNDGRIWAALIKDFCDEDLCNTKNVSVPTTNGLKCNAGNCYSTMTVECKGPEDHCFLALDDILMFRGCFSKNFCEMESGGFNITCCEENLCNTFNTGTNFNPWGQRLLAHVVTATAVGLLTVR